MGWKGGGISTLTSQRKSHESKVCTADALDPGFEWQFHIFHHCIAVYARLLYSEIHFIRVHNQESCYTNKMEASGVLFVRLSHIWSIQKFQMFVRLHIKFCHLSMYHAWFQNSRASIKMLIVWHQVSIFFYAFTIKSSFAEFGNFIFSPFYHISRLWYSFTGDCILKYYIKLKLAHINGKHCWAIIGMLVK